MDTFIVVIVLLLLIALLAGATWFYIREAGPEHAQQWLTSPLKFTNLPGAGSPLVQRFRGFESRDISTSTGSPHGHSNVNASEQHLVLHDEKLRALAEELRGELTRAARMSRDFDSRLTRIEADVASHREIPTSVAARFDEFDQTIRQRDKRTRQRVSQVRAELRTVRRADSPHVVRRCEVLAELYHRLARVDASLATVINPMLLPGEPLVIPEPMYEDTLNWDNWQDVGDRSFAFSECFNENRLQLDLTLANAIETFIATMRSALTETVYPVVQNPNRSAAQKQQMREGLESVTRAIPPLRRSLEDAYQANAALIDRHDVDDDDSDD